MIRPLILIALTAVLASPALATGPAGDTSRVRPNGTICSMVPVGTDDWGVVGITHRQVCRTIATAPGQPAVTPPASLARLPRR